MSRDKINMRHKNFYDPKGQYLARYETGSWHLIPIFYKLKKWTKYISQLTNTCPGLSIQLGHHSTVTRFICVLYVFKSFCTISAVIPDLTLFCCVTWHYNMPMVYRNFDRRTLTTRRQIQPPVKTMSERFSRGISAASFVLCQLYESKENIGIKISS